MIYNLMIYSIYLMIYDLMIDIDGFTVSIFNPSPLPNRGGAFNFLLPLVLFHPFAVA